MRRFVIAVMLLVSAGIAHGQGTVTEVIPLGYRSLHEMVPIVQPMVGPGGSVSGLRDQMVVTTTPARMAEIKKVLQTLDASPERLVISVRQRSSDSIKQRSAAIHAETDNVSIGGGGVRIGNTPPQQPEGDSHVSIAAADRSREDDANIVQRVQVLEGREAYISGGQDLPVRSRGIGYDSVGYYPARTGFYVVPRLNGEEVLLEISAGSRQAATVRRSGYRQPDIDVSSVATTVSGRLGEWISLGGARGSEANASRGIGYTGRQATDTDMGMEVKVEKIQEYR